MSPGPFCSCHAASSCHGQTVLTPAAALCRKDPRFLDARRKLGAHVCRHTVCLITGWTPPSYFAISISCLPGDHVPSGRFTQCCLQEPPQWVYKREMSPNPLLAKKKKEKKKGVVQVERGFTHSVAQELRCCGNSPSQ